MANNLGRSILSSLLGGGQLHDYSHAAKVFRSNGFSRAGKYKYMFHVYFNLNTSVAGSLDPTELSYFVKTVELPKFNFDLRVQNQYNKKQITQHKINYQPVSIKFHDDNANQIRELWRTYYNYYIADGRYTETMVWPNDIYDASDARLATRWGLDADAEENFFYSIDIYSLYAGQSFKISLLKPIISAFNHDVHDYGEGNSLMEHTMTLQYSAVKYTNGYWTGTPGFADFQFYDTAPSDIAGDYAGYQVDQSSGSIFYPGEQQYDQYEIGRNNGFANLNQQNAASNLDSPSNSSMSDIDINAMLDKQNSMTNDPYVFPTAYPEDGFTYGYNNNSADVGNNVQGISEGDVLEDSRKSLGTYNEGTWQRQLEEKGYDPKSIAQSEGPVKVAINSGDVVDNASASRLAESFINSPGSVSNKTDYTLAAPEENYPVSFTNQSVLTPNYNGQTWQSDLKDKGYSDSQIKSVEDSLSSVRLAPSVNLTDYAENYLVSSGVA